MNQIRKRPKLGLFGGSFNPIHNGHLQAIDSFIKALDLDRILLVPTAVSFYKNTYRTSFLHRHAMCELAINGFPKSKSVAVSSLEQSFPQGMHTYELIRIIVKQHSDSDIYLLMGSDIYHRLPIWEGVDEILAGASIGVLKRNADKHLTLINEATEKLTALGGKIIFLTDNALPISSTTIRKAIASGCPIGDAVPECVKDYIQKNGLYLRSFND